MRNLFALVGAATITFVGLGWYLGWYNLSRQPGTPGTQRFNLEVSPTKFTTDVKKGAERVGEIYERLTEDNGKAEPQAPAASQPAPMAPASQFFTPPSAAKNGVTQASWNSLDTAPPPPVLGQPIGASGPRR